MSALPQTMEQDRRISFNRQVRSRRSLHVNDYTHGEIRRCWYSALEQQALTDEAVFASALSDDNESGMEHRTLCGRERRIRNGSAARRAVLAEQRAQKARGIVDPNALAIAYQSVSGRCMKAAEIQGAKDCIESQVGDFEASMPSKTTTKAEGIMPGQLDFAHKKFQGLERRTMSTAAA